VARFPEILMKHLFLALAIVLMVSGAVRAETACLLVAEARSGEVLYQEGSGCEERIGPASTFKFPLGLIGFDAEVLVGPEQPAWPYQAHYPAVRAIEKETTTPRSWMHHSVLWYSRALVRELGAERFASYVADLGYGNADVTGDPGAGNGLTHSWLNSSLQISPAEQLTFIRRFLVGNLPVSGQAAASTAAIMPHFETGGGWTLTGKTGTGYIKEADGRRGNRQFGWFVGWATGGDRTLVFSYLTKDETSGQSAAGPRARDNLVSRWADLLD
jgi:beta-lactamase class D